MNDFSIKKIKELKYSICGKEISTKEANELMKNASNLLVSIKATTSEDENVSIKILPYIDGLFYVNVEGEYIQLPPLSTVVKSPFLSLFREGYE